MSGPPQSPVTQHLASPRRGRHGRRTPLWTIALVAALLGVAATTVYLLVSDGDSAISDQPVGNVAGGFPSDWTAWGFTHTENSVEAQPSSRTAISRQAMLQAQHIMGFGANNPQETPGRYDWSSLDRRVGIIRETSGTPVITLCCAPDWMKGGTPGKTDWGHLTDAPRPEFFDAFAAQAAEVAKRYPDIKYYFVWNEFKGFYNQPANRWDYEGYTELYNKVYTALKNVNPDIKVGGPYMVVNSYADTGRREASRELKGPWGAIDQRALDALKYWLDKKKGADFVVVDGSTLPEDRTSHADEFMALGKFSALTRWLRANDGDLPVVWSEWYVEPENSGWSAQRLQAVQAVAMIEFVQSGAAGALYWSPQGAPGACNGCLWDGSGQPLPTLDMLQNFARVFRPGTELMPVETSSKQVRLLAGKTEMVAVNTADQPVSVKAGEVELNLQPYEVTWTKR